MCATYVNVAIPGSVQRPLGRSRIEPSICYGSIGADAHSQNHFSEDLTQARIDASKAHALDRKAERKLQTARLDELAPRADPGTRERQLEKRGEVTATHAQFREAREGGDMVEVRESDLMGGDEDGVDGQWPMKHFIFSFFTSLSSLEGLWIHAHRNTITPSELLSSVIFNDHCCLWLGLVESGTFPSD